VKIVLGTAQWGWNVRQSDAFELMDLFVEAGHCGIDCATNYPINGVKESHGLALLWLVQWIEDRGYPRIDVGVKVGSRSNVHESASSLDPEVLGTEFGRIKAQLGTNLKGVSIHWDHREDFDQILQTVTFMNELHLEGYNIGFSGVTRPDMYLNAGMNLKDSWHIQVKENVSDCNARSRYSDVFPNAKYLAYSINFGGLPTNSHSESETLSLRNRVVDRFDSAAARQMLFEFEKKNPQMPRVTSLYELALITLRQRPLYGLIVAPRTVDQGRNILSFWEKLQGSA